jgi:hypothetical protein
MCRMRVLRAGLLLLFAVTLVGCARRPPVSARPAAVGVACNTFRECVDHLDCGLTRVDVEALLGSPDRVIEPNQWVYLRSGLDLRLWFGPVLERWEEPHSRSCRCDRDDVARCHMTDHLSSRSSALGHRVRALAD